MNSIHKNLVDSLNNELASFLEGEPQFLYDGVQVDLKSGTNLQIIYPNEKEYVFTWEKNGRNLKIDTAPLHKDLPTFPNHFHCGDELRADAVTSLKNSPRENLKKVIEYIGA